MKSKGLAIGFSSALIIFYCAIILFVMFAVLDVDTQTNFEAAIIFECIGFATLAFLIMTNLMVKQIKTGYFVPIIMVTVIYTIVLDVVNLGLIATLSSELFILVNLILLFMYFLISMPMYVMGSKKSN